MKSNMLDEVLKQMETDPWHVKFRRWIFVQKWVLICRLRFLWDLDYPRNVFRKKSRPDLKNDSF